MTLAELLKTKEVKPKVKTEMVADWILNGELPIDELIHVAEKSKDSEKATCIEALEYVTKERPEIGNEMVLTFVISTLGAKAPRVIWESARVIGNCIHLHPSQNELAIKHLLALTEHTGTVVRWSVSFALGEIAKQKSVINSSLMPTLEKTMEAEEKNSIKKIYQKALKASQ